MFFTPETILFPQELEENLFQVFEKNKAYLGEEQMARSLQKLWPLLAKDHGKSDKKKDHYSIDKKLATAYLSYYLPVNCLKAAFVLEELYLTHGIDSNNLKILDLGCGPATAYWGIAWWAKERGIKIEYVGWDQSNIFTQLAKESTDLSTFPGRISFVHTNTYSSISDLVDKIQPNLILFSNSFGEIAKTEQEQMDLFERILKKSNKQKRYFIIIEPGTKAHSRALAKLKDQFIEKKPLLPCLSPRPCGALTNSSDWCHEEVFIDFPIWVENFGKKANLKKSALLFSYLVYGPGNSYSFEKCSRVVSQRLERKGQWECRICTEEGKKFIRVQKSKMNEKTAFFSKLNRGEIWTKYTALEKGDLEDKNHWESQQSSIFSLITKK